MSEFLKPVGRTAFARVGVIAIAAVVMFCGPVIDGRCAAAEKTIIVQVQRAGIQRFVPGKWTTVEAQVTNQTDGDRDLLFNCWFTTEPGLQFSRRFSIPSGTRRQLWVPVLVPTIPPSVDRTDLMYALIDTSSGREVVIKPSIDTMLESMPLAVTREVKLTGLLYQTPTDDGEFRLKDLDEVREAVFAFHRMFGDRRGVVELNATQLPALPELLSGLDHLVLASDRLPSDDAVLQSIRSWLRQGGRLWIWLDQVNDDDVRTLLGEAFDIDVVGRTSFNDLTITSEQKSGIINDSMSFEKPVRFVHAVVGRGQVTQTVDGWPASFWFPFGQGTVVCATTGPRAWFTSKQHSTSPSATAADAAGSGNSRNSRFRRGSDRASSRPDASGPFPTVSLQVLSELITSRADTAPVNVDTVNSLLTRQIGYRIPTRLAVGGVLGFFCLILLIAGIRLELTQRLDRMLWVTPLMALIAASPLVWLGATSQRTIPNTIAMTQFVDVDPASDELQVRGFVAVYRGTKSDESPGSDRGVEFLPDRTGLESSLWRIVRTDLMKWHVENSSQPIGMRRNEFNGMMDHTVFVAASGADDSAGVNGSDVDAPNRTRVRGTFGPNGFTANFQPGAVREPADMLVAGQSHFSLAVTPHPDGTLTGGRSSVLPPGRYLADSIVSSAQRDRQQIVAELLSSERRIAKYPQRPTLFVWAKSIDVGLQLLSGANHVGSALFAVPIELHRPPIGSVVRIPSPFLSYESVRATAEQGYSAAYQNRNGLWNEKTSGGASTLRFQLPESVLPVTPTRARLSFKIRAGGRDVAVMFGHPNNSIMVETLHNPVGVFSFEITAADVLQPDALGGLHTSIDVGDINFERDPEQEYGTVDEAWRMEWMQLEVDARVDERVTDKNDAGSSGATNPERDSNE